MINPALINQLIESATTDKKKLIILKTAAVKCQEFELAASLREIEKTNFPDTLEVSEAKERAKLVKISFGMAGLNAPESTCWLIDQVLKCERKKKGKFTLMDASHIAARAKEIFPEEV